MRLELGEEVDEDKERHGADWQGTKQPYQLALTPRVRTRSGQGVTPSTKQSCACMLGWDPWHKMQAVLAYIWREA